MSNQKPSPELIDRWGRIHFHFFGEEEVRKFRTRWKDMVVRHVRPEIAEVPSGLIRNLQLSFTRKNDMLVGVYDGDNQPVEASIRYRGNPTERGTGKEEEIVKDEVTQDNRAAYYLGAKAIHYGHFLLETLCRAWAWETHGAGRVPILQVSPVRSFALSIYALIPNLKERIEIVSSPTRYDNVIVPFPAFVIEHAAYLEFKAMCERMAERATSTNERMTEQPLYLSRAGLGAKANRSLLDEGRLERFLEGQGFRIVRPETLPIADQISLFNKHKWIVARQGSACHSRLFSRQPTNILMLAERLHPNYVLCDMLSEGTAHYCKVLSRPELEMGSNSELVRRIALNEEKLLVFLKKFGLIRGNVTLDNMPEENAIATPDTTSQTVWAVRADSDGEPP